jgi:hypothetical protein
MMDQDDRHLEGWYLQMCDPTLPERAEGEEVAATTVGQPAVSGQPSGFELEP